MGIRKSALALVLLAVGALVACAPKGGSGPSPSGDSPNRPLGMLQGKVTLANATEIDLAEESRSSVIIFASDFCIVCSEEARELSSLFREKGGLPKNIRVLTVLIGAIREDITPWVAAHDVTWTTGIDPGDALFRTYCQKQQTPCVLTYNPANGAIFARNGYFTVNELEKETGTWTY